MKKTLMSILLGVLFSSICWGIVFLMCNPKKHPLDGLSDKIIEDPMLLGKSYVFPLPGVNSESLVQTALEEEGFDDYYWVYQSRSMEQLGEIQSWLRENDGEQTQRTQVLAAQISPNVCWRNRSEPIDGFALHIMKNREGLCSLSTLFIEVEGFPIVKLKMENEKKDRQAAVLHAYFQKNDNELRNCIIEFENLDEFVFFKNPEEKDAFLQNEDVKKKYTVWIPWPEIFPSSWEELKKRKIQVWYSFYDFRTKSYSQTNKMRVTLEKWEPEEL